MELLPLSVDDLQRSDDELGHWLVATWLGFHAEKAGIALDAIPKEWATKLVAESAAMDSDSIKNASLESMFRKACSGDYTTAGRMLRGYVEQGAHGMALEGFADDGIAVSRGRSLGGIGTGKQKKAKAAEWHPECVSRARKMIESGTAPKDVSGILAQRLDKTATTVRNLLQAAGVLPKREKRK